MSVITHNITRGASFQPGQSLPRVSNVTGRVVVRKAFDKAAWHKRKAAEAHAKAKQVRQVETCYRQHVPPQVKYTLIEGGVEALTDEQEKIHRLMFHNRAVGL